MGNYKIKKVFDLSAGDFDIIAINEYYNSPKIIEKYEECYDVIKNRLEEKIYEITQNLKVNKLSNAIDINLIKALFNYYFKANLLKEALNYAILNKNYNLKNVLLNTLKVASFMDAINGRVLFTAIIDSLEITTCGNFSLYW